MVSPSPRPFLIPSLDGLRAVAIVIVFLSHAGLSHVVPGLFGVTVFFFLSGYLITKTGKMLIFSFMHNNYTGSMNTLRKEMERVLKQVYEEN